MSDGTTNQATGQAAAEGPLVIERVFDAPVARLWAAWTEPEQMKKWWGPKDFSAPVINIDFRQGGKYLFCMRGAITPGGEEMDMYSAGVFKEIVPLKKIVWTDHFSDADGNAIPASTYGLEDFPDELVVTITFEDLGDGRTKQRLEHAGAPRGENFDNMNEGWNQSLDKLAASL